MSPIRTFARSVLLAALGLTAACATAAPPARDGTAASGGLTPAQQAAADQGRPPFTAADVRFMQAMIGHHAQALVMAAMSPTHGASSPIPTLSGRIEVSQNDEIAMMRRWLLERGQEAPDPADHARHAAMGHASGEPMPGMLTAAELARRDAARGVEFDRLFLEFMIRHHEGAVTMVHQLFAAQGAGQDITIFRLASDIQADQTTEIERMRLMLDALAGR